jgi:beta-galactosidase
MKPRIIILRLTIFLGMFAAASLLSAQSYAPPAGSRTNINLDLGWRFLRQDTNGAQNILFDDSSWTALDLPHTWNNLDGQDGGNNYYRGVGWYRLHFTPDNSWMNRRLFLKFDGANIVSDVYVNGNFVGEHQGGFGTFVYDVTTNLNLGADNVIAVEVNNAVNTNVPPLSADFTFFGGIYRDVSLLVTDPVHISPLDYGSPGVYLKPTNVSSNSANLQVTSLVSNATPATVMATVRTVITDETSNIVTVLTNVISLPPASLSNVVSSTVIAKPHLWNGLADPYLYRAYVELYNDTNLTDLVSQPLGFRFFSIDPTNGFFLNGQYYDLHGVSMHQDWQNYGWALNNAQRETNFALLKELGATTLRMCHYEHSEYEYELADEAGIILWSESPVINNVGVGTAFLTNAEQQLREMIRQRYNHPSVICWGVFN